MCAPHKIEEENLLGVARRADGTADFYVTPDGVVVKADAAGTAAPQEAPEAPMSRVEAIQILTRGLAFADRRMVGAHVMAIHALAKRAAEEMRRKMRKEGGSHD